MLSHERCEIIRRKHGCYASWAIWAPTGKTAASNVGDLTVQAPESNPGLLTTLEPKLVMLGLNISRPVNKPLGNFHDEKPQAKVFQYATP